MGGGGIKILTTNGVTVENSQISNNNGDGLWFDTDNQNVSVLNNTISNNQKLGIEYEASYNAVISGNTLSNNAQSGYVTGYWGAGLLIQDSESVSATRNLVIANAGAEGIGMMDDTRPPGALGTHAAINNIVEYNTIVMLGSGLNGGPATERQAAKSSRARTSGISIPTLRRTDRTWISPGIAHSGRLA